MSWDPVWEKIFSSQPWGKYPGEDLIRFIARNYYGATDRAAVRILEVGSGTGANLWFIAREGFAAFGAEGSETAVEIARRRLDEECPGWNAAPRHGAIVKADIVALPWPDGFFDAVLDSEAVYCNAFEASCRIYREMHRVTRPGGRLFVRTFATGTWGDGVGRELDARRYLAEVGPMAGKGPSRFTSSDELPRLLSPWRITETELVTRSVDGQREQIREWIVHGVKQ